MGQIYILRNKLNKKKYIGQTTKSLETRLYGHKKSRYKIGRAIKKYGIDCFKIYKFYIPDKFLDFIECLFIKIFNTIKCGYNIETGRHKNKKLSEETKRKISIKNSNPSDRIRKLNSKGKKGKKLSKATKLKISETIKNKPLKEKQVNTRSVICLDTQIIYNSMSDASRVCNILRSSIVKCCCNIREKAGGYKWSYVND